jgi:hypothetical protein
LRCKSILSEIDFNSPIDALKSMISQQKITSKKALKTVLEIIKNEAKALEVARKEEELQKKYENGEMDLTFSVDGSSNGNSESMKIEDKNDEDSSTEKKEENDEIKEGEIKHEAEKDAENEVEKEVEEEEVEEVPFQYIPNPVLVPLYFEIKAGTKEQAVLDSLDEVRGRESAVCVCVCECVCECVCVLESEGGRGTCVCMRVWWEGTSSAGQPGPGECVYVV